MDCAHCVMCQPSNALCVAVCVSNHLISVFTAEIELGITATHANFSEQHCDGTKTTFLKSFSVKNTRVAWTGCSWPSWGLELRDCSSTWWWTRGAGEVFKWLQSTGSSTERYTHFNSLQRKPVWIIITHIPETVISYSIWFVLFFSHIKRLTHKMKLKKKKEIQEYMYLTCIHGSIFWELMLFYTTSKNQYLLVQLYLQRILYFKT